MLTDTDDFRVKKTVGSSWNVDEDDVMKTKTALERTGDYKAPAWGVTGFPDDDMFNGLKSFQKREGLAVDGVMKPGGPTEERLRRKTTAQPAAELPKPEIGRELPGGRKRSPDGEEKRPGEVQVAIAPLIPAITAGGAMAARHAPRAWRGLQDIIRNAPPLIGAAEIARREAARQGIGYDDFPSPVPVPPEDRAADSSRANMDRADPPPPTPGLEPPDEKLPDRTESPAAPVELPDLSGSLPESEEPAIFVLPIPEPGEFGDGILERKGNEATRKELERIRDFFLAKGWKHIGGGRYAADDPEVLDPGKPKIEAGGERSETHIPGPGKAFKMDTRPGGKFADLTFEDNQGRIIHIQSVDVDRYGKPTDRELENAEKIRRAEKNTDVILIPKGAQLDRRR